MAAAKYIPGWSVAYPTYFEMAAKANATVTVEVGVWKGLSSAYIASWLRERGTGVHFAVDTWLGDVTMWLLMRPHEPSSAATSTSNASRTSVDAAAAQRDLHLVHGRPSVYHEFLCNIADLKLSPYIVPLSLPSLLAARLMHAKGIDADLVHIDASHEYDDVVADLRAWWPRVRCGGILMGDDYARASNWPGVRRAVDEFVQRERLSLMKRDGNAKWAVQRDCSRVLAPEQAVLAGPKPKTERSASRGRWRGRQRRARRS